MGGSTTGIAGTGVSAGSGPIGSSGGSASTAGGSNPGNGANGSASDSGGCSLGGHLGGSGGVPLLLLGLVALRRRRAAAA
jgi:uncharacterized protein (TIGR03382 family)